MRREPEAANEWPEVAGRTWDVIVIGAGPAGALSALLAARAGATALLVERKPFPRPKVCGGCLNASAVALLDALALGDIVSMHGLPIDHLCVGLRGRHVTFALPGGVAISRARLDSELVHHAREAGVEFLPETRAVLGQEEGSTRDVALTNRGREAVARGRVVVVASGLGGAALGESGAFTTRIARGSRVGAACLVEAGPDEYAGRRISMAVGRSGYVGLTRTIDGLAIASATDIGFLKLQGGPARAAAAILEEAGFPPVPAMLRADWSGTPPLTRSTRPLAASRAFLIGDAAGYVEPFTGQGMAIAVQGAVALSPHVLRAIRGWSPAIATAWSRQCSKKIGTRHWPASLFAMLARRPRCAAFAFALAGAVPILPDALIRYVNRPAFIHPAL